MYYRSITGMKDDMTGTEPTPKILRAKAERRVRVGRDGHDDQRVRASKEERRRRRRARTGRTKRTGRRPGRRRRRAAGSRRSWTKTANRGAANQGAGG